MIIYIEMPINNMAVEPAQFCGEFALQAIVKVEKLSRAGVVPTAGAGAVLFGVISASTGWRE